MDLRSVRRWMRQTPIPFVQGQMNDISVNVAIGFPRTIWTGRYITVREDNTYLRFLRGMLSLLPAK